MKLLLVLLSFVVATLADEAIVIDLPPTSPAITLQEYFTQSGILEERIIGGSPAVTAQFPWMVAVRTTVAGRTSFCGGALLSDIWVLTAAHCVVGNVQTIQLQVGGITLNANEAGRVTVNGNRIIIHANYNPRTLNNDVALVRLNTRVNFNDRIRPIRLPNRGETLPANIQVRVSGWGRTSDTATGVSNRLMFVDLRSITNAECARVYGTATIIGSVVCARGNPHHSTCNGDSGGPLIRVQGGVATHVGVVSFVHRAGCGSGNPSGYMRTESFLAWIASQTGLSV